MRLHTLSLTAFGPFGGTQQVDFDELSAAGLFLLQGATGAGKTSVLDAVCFALYGSVPGARQQPGGTLRSDHADAHTPTQVVLDLTVGGRRLEITRRPEQPRPKKSGTGTTRERAYSALREYETGPGRWKPLSRSHQEIGEEIGLLTGMSRDQFCQVALLPQGEFARFLRADAEDRAKLLGRLFDTGRFAAVEEELARMRRDAQDAVRGGGDALLALAHRIRQAAGGHAGLEPADAAPVPEQRSGEPAGPDPAEVLALAAVARSGAREIHDIAVTAARGAEERHTGAVRLHDETRELDGLQRRYAEARLRSERLAERARERRQTGERLRQARDATTVLPVLALRDAAAAEHDDAAAAEAHSRAALPAGLGDADPGRLTERERAIRHELGSLETARRAAQRSQAITAELDVLEQESRADEEILRDAAEWLTGWDDTRRAHQQRVQDAQDAATRAEHLAGQREETRRRLEAARRRDRLAEELAPAEKALLQVRQDAAAAREHWLGRKERRLHGIAAELAAGLRSGTPCMVCGSPQHPEPARPGAGHVDQHAEDTALEAHQRAEAAREDAEHRLRATREQLAAACAECGDDVTRELAAAVQELETAHGEAHAAAAGAHAAREALDRAEREHATRLAAQQDAERRSASRTSRRESLQRERTALDEELRRLGAGPDTTGPDSAERRAAALDREASCLAGAAEATRTAQATALRLEDAATRLAAALESAHFRSAEEARAAALDDAAQRTLQERVDAWQAEELAVSSELSDPRLAAAGGRPAADPETAGARVEQASQQLRRATAAQDSARTRCRDLDALGAQADAEVRRTAPLREAHARVAGLAALAAGTSAANVHRMRLETYVLAARLEQVAAAASVRLARMSGGRYTLVHSDVRASGRGRSGLGLHVVDSWTGVQRDTATLSGGETFFASLALALGLADVVTDEAGGTRLETLFIDEGFGSLDEQTLDEVLDVLDTLRERDRSVGIVSHVADLRRRIPAQLEVVKTRSGSSLRRHTAPLGG